MVLGFPSRFNRFAVRLIEPHRLSLILSLATTYTKSKTPILSSAAEARSVTSFPKPFGLVSGNPERPAPLSHHMGKGHEGSIRETLRYLTNALMLNRTAVVLVDWVAEEDRTILNGFPKIDFVYQMIA